MLENREGQRVPQVTFHVRRDGEWVDVTTDEIFAGRRVVLFALPGAYTPTCSSTHLPRYDELAPVFREHGVDEIVCLSVNDTFVMNQWQQDQGALDVTFLPDGSARFTDGMGMLVDKDDLGFGPRSWRYSMLVEDGVVKKMFIEPEEPGDPFQVSDADTMLRYLAPDAQPSGSVAIFTRRGCPHCTRAKELLVKEDLRFSEIVVGEDVTPRAFSAVTGASAVPQVFIGGKRIGGADDLERYLGA